MTVPTDPVLDPQIVDELRGLGGESGEDFLAELVGQFVDETEPLLAQLHEAFEAGDPSAVARIGHRIKGSAGQMGGQRLAASCSHLEQGAGDLGSARPELQTVETEFHVLRDAWTAQLRPAD
jgi:HPt (histidine-containing phosphotransfer) domain-containing protein